MVQYEQYEQEMKHLQQMIESAHHEIQDKPITTGNIQELQVQISRHEVGRAKCNSLGSKAAQGSKKLFISNGHKLCELLLRLA